MATTGAKSDYLENQILNHVLGSATFTKPAGLFLALCTSAPSDVGLGSSEVSTSSWTNYARKAITFSPATTGISTNASLVDFGVVAGGGATITHYGIMDAATGGNMLYRGDWTNPQIATAGNSVQVPSGALSISED